MLDTDRSPIDAHLVSLNWTQYYFLADEDKPYIKQIREVFLYDANERTHCCEFTPSYYLRHLYTAIIFTRDAPDDVQDRLDEKYAYCPTDDIYVHCHTVDDLPKDREVYYHYGDTGVSYEDSSYEDQIEGLMEHFNCNHNL